MSSALIAEVAEVAEVAMNTSSGLNLNLYGDASLPPGERVCLFLKEKSVDLWMDDDVPPAIEHNEVVAGEVFEGGPVLFGNDRTVIAGVTPICCYLEELFPSPPLLGATPSERANVEMWQRYVENRILSPLGIYFFHGTCAEEFPSHQPFANSAWAEENRLALVESYRRIDAHLRDKQFITGPCLTIADITMYSSIKFGRLVGIEVADEHKNLMQWWIDMACRFDTPPAVDLPQQVAHMH